MSLDGWDRRPVGWNVFDLEDFEDDIIDVDLAEYPHEYIMILAGGLDNSGRNHPWVKDRLDIALRLYQQKTRKIIILGGGTYHKPPHLNRENFVIHESTMGAKYLIDNGVHEDDVYREWGSYDTIANAFFSLTNFVMPLKLGQVPEKRILIITSDFHMDRTKMIFNWIYGLWGTEQNAELQVDYLEVSTKYLDNEIIDARASREKRSLENLQHTINNVSTWLEFHEWFYQEHDAYNCRFNGDKEQIDEQTKKSY